MANNIVDKQKQLEKLFVDLADTPKTKEDLDDYIEKFRQIYTKDFRPLYSKLLLKLEENFKLLYEKVCETNGVHKEYGKGIVRIYDHLTIDSVQLDNSKKFDDTRDKFLQAQTDLDDVKKQVETMQKEYIAILGIFSAIVITFMAGLSFSSSVLQNIDKASIYRLLLIIWILAFVLITILGKLFDFIEMITTTRRESSVDIADYSGSSLVDRMLNIIRSIVKKIVSKDIK